VNLKFTPNFTIVFNVICSEPLPAIAEYILIFSLDKAFSFLSVMPEPKYRPIFRTVEFSDCRHFLANLLKNIRSFRIIQYKGGFVV